MWFQSCQRAKLIDDSLVDQEHKHIIRVENVGLILSCSIAGKMQRIVGYIYFLRTQYKYLITIISLTQEYDNVALNSSANQLKLKPKFRKKKNH